MSVRPAKPSGSANFPTALAGASNHQKLGKLKERISLAFITSILARGFRRGLHLTRIRRSRIKLFSQLEQRGMPQGKAKSSQAVFPYPVPRPSRIEAGDE